MYDMYMSIHDMYVYDMYVSMSIHIYISMNFPSHYLP